MQSQDKETHNKEKKVVILQPGYLPWLGFFDLMDRCDIFVILDNVQYTVRDWRSRNRIKTPAGALWLSVPVMAKGNRRKTIKDVRIDNTLSWQKKHMESLMSFYKRSRYYSEIIDLMRNVYEKPYTFLIDVDMDIIKIISRYLALPSEVIFASDVPSSGEKDKRLLSICSALGATQYLSGNAAQGYLREPLFREAGIHIEWHNFQHPYYHQLWLKEQGFISHLSIVDLLFAHGPDSHDILEGHIIIERPQGVTIRHADDARP